MRQRPEMAAASELLQEPGDHTADWHMACISLVVAAALPGVGEPPDALPSRRILAETGVMNMTATARDRAHILIVEDDPAIALMLTDQLQIKGYSVSHAANAAEAEAMVDEVCPDLI